MSETDEEMRSVWKAELEGFKLQVVLGNERSKDRSVLTYVRI